MCGLAVSQLLFLFVSAASLTSAVGLPNLVWHAFLSGTASTGGNRPMERGQLKSTPVLDGFLLQRGSDQRLVNHVAACYP